MKSTIVFGVLAVVLIASSAAAAPIWYSITGSRGSYNVQQGQQASAIAEAYYESESIQTTGWATLGLYTRSKSSVPKLQKAHAAGYLEGAFCPAPRSWVILCHSELALREGFVTIRSQVR